MWENLLRVNWAHLTHAYGRAHDAPKILRKMISQDKKAQAAGWDAFWGSLNHQGDYYDSTVAAIPFLIEAAASPDAACRAAILRCLRDRWLGAPNYGGDPIIPEPPGGVDIPTPMLTDAEFAASSSPVVAETEEESVEDFDIDSYRRMDLCAWQTGRAIYAGRPTFEKLLSDADRTVAAAAAALLLLWPETRAAGKRALICTVSDEPMPTEQASRILEFGVYGATADEKTFTEWTLPHQPAVVRAAAVLAWAWAVNPAPLPAAGAAALRDVSVPNSDAFAKLPWVGLYHRGPWILPANIGDLIVRLADNDEKEIRWRAVQGFQHGHESAKHITLEQAIPVLIRRLADKYNRIRDAAAFALSQHGEAVLDIEPNLFPALVLTLEDHVSAVWGDATPSLDSGPTACGHAARLLAALAHRLTPSQRTEAAAAIGRAAQRQAGRTNQYVMFQSSGFQASTFLNDQRQALLSPVALSLPDLFAAFAFPDSNPRMSSKDCDRRLADAYRQAPHETLDAAIAVLEDESNRNGAIGAALWLMTLGPKAQLALAALDGCARGKLDNYARGEFRTAAQYIREALTVAQSNDRSVSAEASRDIAAWENQLLDETVSEVGIVGEFQCDGRLYHWRTERRSSRAAAIQKLFESGHVPQDGRMLAAMLAEAKQPAVICGKAAIPTRFRLEQWRSAVDAAGGLSRTDPLIRSARQECQDQPWPGNNAPYACAAELAEIIRVLSGRLI